MAKRLKKDDYKEAASDTPDLNALREGYNLAVQKRDSNVFARQRRNYEARNCLWANQSPDGRKWRADKGKEVFPWAGASDARVHLIDMYINQDVALLMTAWSQLKTKVYGTESNDDAFANRLTECLRWMKYTQMGEAHRESRLAANYLLERGSTVMAVLWEKENQLAYEEIDMEQIRTLAQQMAQKDPQNILVQLPAMIMDETMDPQTLQLAEVIYPDVKPQRLKKVISDLRSQGHAKFPRPYEVKNRPTIVALAMNEDFFIPPETTDFQGSRAMYRREVLTEADLRERVESHGWDLDWVEETIRTKRGVMTMDHSLLGNQVRGSLSTSNRINARAMVDTSQLFEVAHAYRRLSDEDGVPGIYYTCFSPAAGNTGRAIKGGDEVDYAYHDLLNYDHGQFPFVLIEREVVSRSPDDSRGYGEIAGTWQQSVKTEWDSRGDRTSMATLPPSYHPPGEAPDQWGPGVQVPTNRPDSYGFMEAPKFDPGSKEIEETVRKFADEYFGRVVNPLDPVTPQMVKQDMVRNWIFAQMAIDTQILQLMQQFMPDEFYFRVVGSQKGQSIKASREEIQGKFDVSMSFQVENLDPEIKKAKMGLIEQGLQMDVNGIIDRNEALVVVFDMIEPNLGERLIKPAEAASQHEIEDEQTVFAKMFAGVDVDIKPGQAYGLRLQVLKNIFANNPKAQKAYQQDPDFKALLEKRVKQLEFGLAQQPGGENARIGATTGTKPSAQAV